MTGGSRASLLPQPASVAASHCGVRGREGRIQRRQAHEVSVTQLDGRAWEVHRSTFLNERFPSLFLFLQGHISERVGGARREDAARWAQVAKLKSLEAE